MFLQSQIASPQDKIALLELEFNVVNGIYGAHQGFTLIDKDTVVVDFNSFFPVRRITCDIALPAMIICPRAPDLPDQGVKTFTVDDPDVNGGVRLDVVGHDMCVEKKPHPLSVFPHLVISQSSQRKENQSVFR